MRNKVLQKKAETIAKEAEISDEKQELDKKIEQLMKKKFSYSEDVERVRMEIKEEFQRIGRTPEPRILVKCGDYRWILEKCCGRLFKHAEILYSGGA